MKQSAIEKIARDIIDIWGEDADRICLRKALAADDDGDKLQATGWRRIKDAVNTLQQNPNTKGL
jgi:hypothetical protein